RATITRMAAAYPWKGRTGALRGRRFSLPPSDEEDLCPVGHLDEVGGVDDAIDVVAKIRLGELVHVRGHPAGPEVAAGGHDLVEEVRHLGDAEIRDLLLHHLRRH